MLAARSELARQRAPQLTAPPPTAATPASPLPELRSTHLISGTASLLREDARPPAATFERRVVTSITARGYRIGDAPTLAMAGGDGGGAASLRRPPVAVTAETAPATGGTAATEGRAGGAHLEFSIASSDSENDDEAFMRRRTPVKEMKLDALPTANGLRRWVHALVSEACRCSNRSKTRTLRYLRQVFFATEIAPLETIPPKWDPFDTELASALQKTATGGAIAREIQLYQERCSRELRPFGGRPVLFMILKRYELNYGQALQVDLSSLSALKFSGDLEAYLDALDSRLSVMVKEPDESLLLAIVEPELRQCPELALEFGIFDRAPAGAYEQSLKYLYDSARALCDRKRRQKTLDGLKEQPKKVNLLTRAETEARATPEEPRQIPCILWRSGSCRFGEDCKFVHFRNKEHTPTAGCPAGTVIKLGAQPGDDCWYAANPSECPYGDECIFRHGPDDERDINKIVKDRSPPAGKGGWGKGKKTRSQRNKRGQADADCWSSGGCGGGAEI